MERKHIIIIAIIVAIIFVVGLVIINSNGKKEKKEEQAVYFTNENGEKVNNSSGIETKKTVGNYIIENSQIVRSSGVSTLTAKVTNTGNDATNVRFKVTFYDNDNNIITTATVLAGDIKQNSSAYINAGISADVSEATNLVYEIK